MYIAACEVTNHVSSSCLFLEALTDVKSLVN